MRRAGGVYVGAVLITGAVQAVTGFIPAVPSAADSIPAAKPKTQGVTFTGTSEPIREGSVPVKKFEDLINVWGNLCKQLTPAILAGQLYQESIGFDPDVVAGRRDSPAGARGVAQFMPATWEAHGIDANGDGKRNILDPEDAIPSAATYDCTIAKDVKNVPGDPTTNMLASYNAGSGAVLDAQGVPPYNETQNYVRLIRKHAAERFERK